MNLEIYEKVYLESLGTILVSNSRNYEIRRAFISAKGAPGANGDLLF